MSTTRTNHPRRVPQKSALDTTCSSPLSNINPKSSEGHPMVSLRKGATFHGSKQPSKNANDPVINAFGIQPRSPTSPKYLEELVAGVEQKLALAEKSTASASSKYGKADPLPVPEFLVAHASLPDIPNKTSKYDFGLISSSATAQNIHSHDSDSGLGSSVSSVTSLDQRTTADRLHLTARSSTSVYTPTARAGEHSLSTALSGGEKRGLSDPAVKHIQQRIIEPLLADEEQKDYHKLVKRLPSLIANKDIVCLRDLEKSLVFLAPSTSKSAASYYKFCVTSIDLIVQTVDHVSGLDRRQPSDRPYSNNYFVDLIEQVRQYAGIMAASRQKQAEGKPLDKDDVTNTERLSLTGGISINGRPAELVRETEDGKTIPIDTKPLELDDDFDDDDPERSMARKRKCDIGKEVWHACRECGRQFKRPCDLTKHEKQHSRPFKCKDPNCKYAFIGWPTEKEMERHYNDKHTDTPSLYHCLWEGCQYTSKRESNCKQHMEKSHGYDYVRSKSKKADRLVPLPQGSTPQQSALPTPSSAYQSIPTPASSDFTSPHMGMMNNELSPPATDEGASPFAGNMHGQSLFDNNASMMGGNFDTSLNFGELQPTDMNTGNAMGTPITIGSGDLFSEGEPLAPENPWDMRLDFGELVMEEGFPSPEDFFSPQYGHGAQQPTPAMSDFDLSKDMMQDNSNKMASTAQDPMFNQQQDSLPSSAFTGADFSLFGEQGESSNMAAMFADLNGNNQFQQQPQNGNASNTFDYNAFGGNM